MTLYWLQTLGIVAFAASGALAGRRDGFDIVGCLACALMVGLGGGTLRDLLLGRLPVFWIHDETFLIAGLVGGALGLGVSRWRLPSPPFFVWLEAFGLGLFAVAGAQITLVSGAGPISAVLLGVMTAAAGSVLRQIACGSVPTIFKPGILEATAAALGCIAFLMVSRANAPELIDFALGVLVAAGTRIVAVRRQIRLP